jgi:NAD(P)-dependent dehydrogenase (short-subunit alcohol dehydrogenase family)
MTSDLTNPAAARLAGRTAVVTGSTSGIGSAIARTLAAEGAHVVVSGRDVGRGKDVVEDIRAAGGRAEFVEADLGGPYAQLREFVAEATARLGGRVDILVNNAGIYPATSTEDRRTPISTPCLRSTSAPRTSSSPPWRPPWPSAAAA